MHDARNILLGLALFVGAATAPFGYQLAWGTMSVPVVLELPPGGAKQCVADTKTGGMRAQHSRILDQWRTDVVRDGKRLGFTIDGVEYETSLTKTCLNCHANQEQFCDRCHDANGVTPSCWNCHRARGATQ